MAYPAASISRCIALLVSCTLAAIPLCAMADDIDIFIGAAGRADAPNIMVLLDNGPNWSRQSQGWDSGQTQGKSETNALSNVLNTVTTTNPAYIGLALLTDNAGAATNGTSKIDGGGYIRFGARDMSDATNRTALQNILGYIGNNVTSNTEKVGGMKNKEESAGLYELYKYFSGLAPFSGAYIPGSSYPNVNADDAANRATYSAYGQGLRSGFAINNGLYQSPINSANPCAKNFIVYIVNNANNAGSLGLQTYQPSVASAGADLPPVGSYNAWTDEWALFLRNMGAVTPSGGNGSIITYVIDVYHDQNNAAYSTFLMNVAKEGGGTYLHADGQVDIETKLKLILAEIQGVNSTFASASLPVNTTNRSQDKNQVFIPMFRPDATTAPRWMGNLKQYQLINYGSSVELGDSSSPPQLAVNPLTGYPTDCAVSYWTTDSQQYWANVTEDISPKGNCTTNPTAQFSDAPDGPFVEKGGVAEVIRKGNAPATTNATPTWTVNRNIYTQSGSSLVAFTASSSQLSQTLVNFIVGYDVNHENGNGSTTDTRPSLHGDAIHSRPLPIDYGGTTGVTAFYGSNDGMLRAVDSATGAERWAFIAPEFFGKLQRLMDNSPLINYPTTPAGVTPTPIPKDYFFDGSIGVYQSINNSKVWIYPTMRRGGRMLYALDVTNPASPVFKWKAGCPDLTDDKLCVAPVSGDDFTGIGQTWSIPKVVPTILGSSSPVLIIGGGYDGCEDANTATPSCSTPKGAIVYILDANTGAIIRSFPTLRSVVADVALAAVATSGIVDHAYVADTGGNIYRIDFAADPKNWVMNRIAYTNGAGRKFLFAPAVLPAPGGKVYLALGSGDREHPLQMQYPFANVLNRFYVYLDDTSSISASATNLDDTNLMNDFTTGTSCSVTGVLPGSSTKGWFMNLNQYGQGEQTVTSALIAAGMVTFSTNRPIPPQAGSCSTMLGQARGYWVNLFNASGAIGVTGSCGGDRSGTFVGGGLPPSPMFGTVPVDGQPTSVILGAVQRDGGASSPISPQRVLPTIVPKRKAVYWKSSGTN